MANRGIELNGIDQLLQQLRQRGEQASKKVERQALRAAGHVMADDMAERANRSDSARQYHLQDNITVSGVRRKDGVKYVLVGPNKKVAWRAHFPEFGTSKMPATPYITPGFLAKRKESLLIIADVLREGLSEK